ncbi:MAG: hypothetical protein ACI9VS_000697 [Candidatus Binatia bacterium]|jgi:hypothetical protein
MTEYRYSRFHLLPAFALPFFQFDKAAQAIAVGPPSDSWLTQPIGLKAMYLLFDALAPGYGWYWLSQYKQLGVRISLGEDCVCYETRN